MSQGLKIGLIGAGVFAGYHANKLSAHPRVDFVGIYDADEEKAAALSETHKISAYSLVGLLAESDAVIIAASATFHGEIGLQALDAGCHCLIEKPLATSVQQAEAIVMRASEKGLRVQVGHQERMVLRAIGLDLINERPLAIKAVRSNPYSKRGTDTSVTMDLMTHDIDLCTALFEQAPDRVDGHSTAIKSKTADEAQGRLHYGDAVAELTASRIVETGERYMMISYPSGEVHIDFNAKTLTHSTPFDLNTHFAEDSRAADSLGAATDVFVRAVLDGSPVLVSAEDGAVAVQVAAEIDG